jgi:hypothetical protein
MDVYIDLRKKNDEGYLEMKKNKIKILHVAQAAGGVDRYIRMLLKYLDKEKFENILVCSQDFHEEDYRDLVDSFEQVEMSRAIQQKSIAQQNADKQKIENEAAIAKAEADKQVAITNAEAEAQKGSTYFT